MTALDNTMRKLRRDLRQHPAKAGALGLLLLVAAWFWIPMVTSLFSGDKAASPPVTTHAPSTPTTDLKQASPAKAGPPRWKQMVKQMANDANMQPAVVSPARRDPFVNAQSLAKDGAEAKKQLSPSEAGLAVNSTVIGTGQKTALINGRAYHEGQLIRSPKGKEQFELVEIQSGFVVLRSDGRRYRLRLPNAEFAGAGD